MEKRSMVHRGVYLLLFTCLIILSIVGCQSVCPARCLCYLDRIPRTVVCSKQGLQTFPENISDVVEHLDLSSNLLIEITEDLNRLADLQYLNLARNQISSLPKDLGQLKKLRRLDLTENNIGNTADIASISQLSSLVILYVSRNPLTDLTGLTSQVLQAMDAGHCTIKELGNASLDGLTALTTLNLAGNPLKSIQRPVSETLRWLDMSDCNLNYLYPDSFSGLPEVEELRLANNPTLVYSTRHSTLEHLKLKRLDVSRCNLDRPGLHGFPSLTHVRLSRNAIYMLPDRIFSRNRQLTHLSLNANGLEQLNASTFEGLVKLQMLDLSVNNLAEVNSLAFHENIDLRILNLSYNALSRLPNLSSMVTSLDVSFNLIRSLTADSLENMPRIRSLNLKDNRLQSLPHGLRSATLKILDVQRNRLVELYNDSFTELPSLQKIDLSGNRLTEAMEPEIFRNNPDLAVVRLDDNPWRCDCIQLYVTYEYLTNTSPPKTVRSSLICQSPANVSGYSWEAACYAVWNNPLYYNKERTWGFVMISLLILVVLCGSVVSIRHTMKIKRRAIEQRRDLERAEARERLRLLQRRNQHLDEELLEYPEEPRIHPLELIGPPSYEEAVQMPRLVHSMDALNEITVENGTMHTLGSVDNLRIKKRRTRRSKKRTQSEDDLLRREERRQERIRRARNNSTGNVCDTDHSRNGNPGNPRTPPARRRSRRHSVMDESVESSSSKDRPRPQTPNARKRKRRQMIRDEHVTDDEDSDVQTLGSNRSIIIREFKREPKSGYKGSCAERDS